MPELIPLDYGLPLRHWVRTAHGWSSRDWTPEERTEAAQHLFKTDAVRELPDGYSFMWFGPK